MTVKTSKKLKECGEKHPTKKNVYCRMHPNHDGPHWFFDVNSHRKNVILEIEWSDREFQKTNLTTEQSVL